MAIATTDLTQRPPRSPRVRLGGYAILPRMLDKGRAVIAGKQGEFKYACPLDQEFLNFVGIDPEKLREQLAAGKGDGEILEWIKANAKNKREPHEIEAWSCYQDRRTPGEVEKRSYLAEIHEQVGPKRADIVSWFDLLDLDDHVSYGGKA
jgi:hypothetical protein